MARMVLMPGSALGLKVSPSRSATLNFALAASTTQEQ